MKLSDLTSCLSGDIYFNLIFKNEYIQEQNIYSEEEYSSWLDLTVNYIDVLNNKPINMVIYLKER